MNDEQTTSSRLVTCTSLDTVRIEVLGEGRALSAHARDILSAMSGEKPSRYIATLLHSEQTGPDSAQTFREVKVCDETTTIAEIVEWYRRYFKVGHVTGIEIIEES